MFSGGGDEVMEMRSTGFTGMAFSGMDSMSCLVASPGKRGNITATAANGSME